MLGLSKPNSLNIGALMKVNPFTNFNYGKGINTTVKLAMDPENQISTAPVRAGISHDEMDLMFVIGTPQLVNIVSFLQDSDPFFLCYASPFDYNMTFVDFVARNFLHWSGSYKIKLYITASLFHTVKAVVWFTNDIGADWQDSYYKIVDIQGDTEVDITLPYWSSRVAEQVADGTDFGLAMKILTWSTPNPTASCPIHVCAYKAGGSDYQVGVLLETQFTPSCNPRADFAESFPTLHASMKGYTHEGLIWGEKYTTIREIVHRNHLYWISEGSDRPYRGSLLGKTGYHGIELWGQLYRFWSGGICMCYIVGVQKYISTVGVYTTSNSNTFPISGTYVSSATNPQLEFEVPYYYKDLYQSTNGVSPISAYVTKNTNLYLCKSAGDDFSFHFLRAAPSGAIAAPAALTGTPGLRAWNEALAP
jgi:hypothetical protein